MSNNAYLLNTSILTSDPYLLSEKSDEPGKEYLEIASAAYKIPVPWLLCFQPEDMQIVKVQIDDDEGGARFVDVRQPCTTVERALDKMQQSLPVFEAITGETRLATMFWQMAVSCLQSLPLPYLTLNIIEVMFMDEPVPYEESMLAALGKDVAAIGNMKDLSCYDHSAPPFPPDVLYATNGGDRNNARLQNCVALDIGYGSYWHQPGGSERRAKLPLPTDSLAAPNLKSVMLEITTLAKGKVASASTYLTVMPQRTRGREQLKMLISADTDAECDTLIQDAGFKNLLDGPILSRMKGVCQDHGFEWLGYVVRSDESVEKRFTGDYAIYDDWITMPVASAGATVRPVKTAGEPQGGKRDLRKRENFWLWVFAGLIALMIAVRYLMGGMH